MAQEQNFDEEIILKNAGRSKSGSLKLPKLRNRFSDPKYIKALSSDKSEAVVKVGSRLANNKIGYLRGYQVKRLLDYIARIDNPEKDNIECEDDLGSAIKGRKDILNVYDEWKTGFKKQKPGLKRKGRDAVHIVLSSDCENTNANAKKVLEAARDVIKKEIGEKGFDFVSAIHRDGKKPHVHFAVRCKNRYPNQGVLRLNQPEIFKIRTKFAERLTELGLDHVATLKRDRPSLMERVANGIERLQKNEKQFQRAMKRAAPSRDAFMYRQKALKTIVRLREQIKKETTPKSKERRDLLSVLRKTERQLTKQRPGIEKEIAATLNAHKKDLSKFNKAVSTRSQVKISESLEKQLDKERTVFKENIAFARESIKNSDAPELLKKDSLLALKQYEKDMNKALQKDLLKSKVFAFEKDFKVLSTTAKKALELHEQKPKSAVEQLERRRQLDKFSQELGNQIKIVQKNIQKSTVRHKDKKNALADLKSFENKVSKQINRQLKPKGLSLTR